MKERPQTSHKIKFKGAVLAYSEGHKVDIVDFSIV
jgi:hypothetical protein